MSAVKCRVVQSSEVLFSVDQFCAMLCITLHFTIIFGAVHYTIEWSPVFYSEGGWGSNTNKNTSKKINTDIFCD